MKFHQINKFLVIFSLICFSQINAELVELREDNWRLMLEGDWMVEFFAPWCPACKSLSPIWTRFSKTAKKENVNVAKIDVTLSPSLSGRFFVTALPTIYHVHNGEFRQYRGSRDEDSFLLFIKQKQWQKIDKLSAWKQPDSIHMSLLSYFFKLSHYLKDVNTQLHEEYGLPTWGAYAIFAVSTILIGAILGLLLVCIVDFLYPPKKAHRQSFSESNKNLKNSIEDVDDDLEDDEQKDDESNAGDDNDEDEDDKEKDDENADDKSETSEGEKYSNSEEESDTNNKNENVETLKDDESGDHKSSPKEIRKRRPRKAD